MLISSAYKYTLHLHTSQKYQILHKKYPVLGHLPFNGMHKQFTAIILVHTLLDITLHAVPKSS